MWRVASVRFRGETNSLDVCGRLIARVSFRRFGGAAVSAERRRFLVSEADANKTETRWIDRRVKRLSMRLNEPERASLLIPVERQARVVHQLAGGEIWRLQTAEQGGNDVGSEQREAEEPGCIRGYEAV